jgi:hypothetical protein
VKNLGGWALIIILCVVFRVWTRQALVVLAILAVLLGLVALHLRRRNRREATRWEAARQARLDREAVTRRRLAEQASLDEQCAAMFRDHPDLKDLL